MQLKESFSLAPALFVEDGAVGSDRRSEIRVRVISDSANYALFFRNMLVRVCLSPCLRLRMLCLCCAPVHG